MQSMQHIPALYSRRARHPQDIVYIKHGVISKRFKRGSVLHVKRYDLRQEVYGLPAYLAALNAAWLNESATLFRRKYYENGAHMGFILYLSGEMDEDSVDDIEDALQDAKGVGNFQNMLIHDPGGDDKKIKLMPVGEITAKDDFWNVKNVTRDDVLAMHRIPPQIMGIIPTNTSGFGNAETAARVFARNEVEPLQRKLQAINRFAKREVLRFKAYELSGVDGLGSGSG